MYANPLLVVPILFGLSLAAAVILFRFLKSSAVIQTAKYQAGGAIAGFVIVYGLLHFSFEKISGFQDEIKKQEQTIYDLKSKTKDFEEFTASRDITGTVDPYSDHTKIVLVVTETDLPVNKRFRLTAPCLDLKKGRYALYVIQEGKNYPYEIFPEDNIAKLNISIPPQ